MKKCKRYLFQFCLVLVGFCVALLLAEGFIRVFYPYSRDHVVPGGLFEIDDYLGWKFKEGKNAIHHSRYFEATYRINTLGYRDRPRSLLKEAEIYRILLYGDSQIFGWGIPAQQRFSNLIEAQMPHLEMWNLAVPGYGLDQEVLSYEKQGQLFNADEVIFFVSQATLHRTRCDYIYRKHKPKFVIDQNDSLRLVRVQQGTNVWTRLFYRVLSPLYLPYFVDRRLAVLKRTPKQAGDAPNQKITVGSDAIGELEKRILDRARNIARERKHRMTIIADLSKILGKELQNFCNQRKIGFLHIVLPKEDPDLSFGKNDGHWKPHAHKLITEQLLSQFETRICSVVEDE
ncbi:hypothetical protein ACFL9T_20345 [Thermodesulfobacteriota bacterium]